MHEYLLYVTLFSTYIVINIDTTNKTINPNKINPIKTYKLVSNVYYWKTLYFTLNGLNTFNVLCNKLV